MINAIGIEFVNIILRINLINNFTNFISVKNKEEKKKNNNIFLNKKRGSTSNLSDNSFNSNENEFNNRKSKNNLDKENFLK